MTENAKETPVQDTDAFLAAVEAKAAEIANAAVAKVQDEMLMKFSAMMAKANPAAVNSTLTGEGEVQTLFRQMALSIAEISDQGSNRKRVAPEILAAREAHKERMGELVLAARKLPQHEKPRFKIISKCYLNERFIEPFRRGDGNKTVQNEIYWANVPSSGMRPVNDSAKAIFKEFVGWLGGKEALSGIGQLAQPLWITEKGTVLLKATATATARGLLHPDADVIDFDGGTVANTGKGVNEEDDEIEFVGADDPRKPEIQVLGTLAPPAKRSTPSERANA